MSISKQLRRAAVGVAAVAVLGTVASTALAGGPLGQWTSANDPNTTNVPYLAWRGENLRLVKCFGTNDFNQSIEAANPSITTPVVTNDNLSTLFGQIIQTNVQIEDWSGYDTGINTPKEVINGARTFLYYNMNTDEPVICFQDTWASQKAGLGQFKLTVSFGLNNILNTGVGLRRAGPGHAAPVARRLDGPERADPRRGLVDQPGHEPRRPWRPEGRRLVLRRRQLGAGVRRHVEVRPSNAHPGEIRATVKGTLPLGQDFTESFPTGTATLPDDWAKLANALATDADDLNSNPAMRWDIHDEMVDEHGVSTVGYGGLHRRCDRQGRTTSPVGGTDQR